jgi:4'-phosphopantetheinyl transferase
MPNSSTSRLAMAGMTELQHHDIHIWLIDLDTERADTGVPSVLHPDELERARRFHFPEHRRRWAASRTALRHILSTYTAIDAAEIEFNTDKFGKPFLACSLTATTPHFNLSHCENLSVVAVTLLAPVGVDVERIREVPEAADIAKRFFSPFEQEEFLSFDEGKRPHAFLKGWTRKEACLKALGSGLSTSLSHFEVSLDPALPARVLSVGGSAEEARNWSLYDFTPAEGFIGAVAISHSAPIRIVQQHF